MAVYGADVRVKVINLSQLTKLSDKLDQVNKKVNYLNASLQKLGKKFKAPNVDIKTDKALKKLQRLNKEWDKLERRRKLKPIPGPGSGGGGGGGRRGGGGGVGANLAKGALAGAGLGLAGPLGGLAGIAASALNPVTLLGCALGVAAVGALRLRKWRSQSGSRDAEIPAGVKRHHFWRRLRQSVREHQQAV